MSEWLLVSGAEFGQAGGDFGEMSGGSKPFAAQPEAGEGSGFDEGGVLRGEFFEEGGGGIAAVEAVVGSDGVDDPILLHAMSFVGGELGAAVAGDGGGGKGFDNKRGGEIGVGVAKAGDLLGGEITEVGEKGVARAEADGGLLAE